MLKEPRSLLTVLEFNCTTIRICCSAIVKGKRVVTHCFSFEAKDSESSTPEKIRQEFKKRGLAIKDVVLALPRYTAASRLMRLPSMNQEELKEMMVDLATREDFSILQTAVDGYMKQGEEYRQEMVMLTHKVDRHEKWIMQIAEKLGLQLKA